MNCNNIGIVPFTYFGGAGKAVGSTFLRAFQLALASNEFTIWKHGQAYESLIFQKVYWKEMMVNFTGPKILDLCDPDWITGSLDLMETGQLVDAFTCSSLALTTRVKDYFPNKIVEWIPDRLNFRLFPEKREPHRGTIRTAVWFGFIHNAHQVLLQLAEALASTQVKLLIIADAPYENDDAIKKLDPEFIEYKQSTVFHLIKKADIVLNPKIDQGTFRYKSNNKSVISWKLGVPVAETPEEIYRFVSDEARNAEVAEKQNLVLRDYNIVQSAAQYKNIITSISQMHCR